MNIFSRYIYKHIYKHSDNCFNLKIKLTTLCYMDKIKMKVLIFKTMYNNIYILLYIIAI